MVVRKAFAVCVLMGVAAGCSLVPPPPPPPVTVDIPVPVACPAPPILALPVLPLSLLNSTSSPADTARAYGSSIEILKGAVRQRDALLDGYRESQNASDGSGSSETTKGGGKGDSAKLIEDDSSSAGVKRPAESH